MKQIVREAKRMKKEIGSALGVSLQILSVTLLGLLVVFAGPPSEQTVSTTAGGATISTDKTDYAPGDTVVMTGSGWTPNVAVALHIDESDGEMWDGSAMADEFGNISSSDFVVQPHDVGVAFSLTATQGDLWAWTQFTDVITPGNAPNGDPGNFEILGNVVATALLGHTDWVSNGVGTTGLVDSVSGLPLNPTVTYRRLDGYGSSPDDAFAGSNKINDNPNTYAWDSGGVNSKTDMNNVYVHISQDATGDRWITASADRLVSNGTSYVDFELNQAAVNKITDTGCTTAPCGHFTTTPAGAVSGDPLFATGGRTPGDLLVTASYGSGGSLATMGVSQWTLVSGTWKWKDITVSIPLNSAFVATNASSISVPYGAFGANTYNAPTSGNVVANQFVEMSIDITKLLAVAVDPCAGIEVKTVFVKTKTSTTDTATLEDFVEPIPVAFSAGFAVSATGTDPNCSTGLGDITAQFSGGTGPYQCKLDSGSFAACTSPITYHNLSAGSHTVTVKDALTCTKTTNTVTTTIPTAVVASAGGTDPTCSTGLGTITASATGGTGSGYMFSLDGGTAQSSGTFNNVAGGSHTVTAMDSNGCLSAATAPVTITIPTAVVASASGTDPLCSTGLGTINASASGGTGSGYMFSLDGGTPQSSGTFSNVAGGSHTVTATDGNGCASAASAPVTITIPTAVVASASGTDPLCSTGLGTINASASGGTGSGYMFSLDGGTPQSSGTFNNVAGGSHTVTATDGNGCASAATAPVSITIPTAVVASASGTNPLCSTGLGTINASATGGTGSGYMFSLDSGTPQSSGTFNNVAGGSHTVTATDSNGCLSAATAPVTITIPPAINASAVGSGTTCGANSGVIATTASGGTGTLTYSLNGTDFQGSNEFSGVAAGTYTVTVKDANGCTKTANQVTINTDTPPTTASAGPDQTVCGLVATLAGNTPSLGTGTWTKVSGPGTVIFGNTNANTPGATATVSASGTYVFSWTTHNGVCPDSSDTVQVTFKANTSTASSINPQTITYGQTNVTLSATVLDTSNSSPPATSVNEGTVHFTIWNSTDTTQVLDVLTTPAVVSGVASTNANVGSLSPGTYHIHADYSGSAHYCPSGDDPHATLQIINPLFTTVPSNLTNSSLACFDTDPLSSNCRQFNLIYSQNSGSGYLLNASNPGQFYDNVLYVDTNPAHLGAPVTIKFRVPYPFVTQGAQPIHVYNSVSATGTFPCLNFTPGTEIKPTSISATGNHYSTSGSPVLLLVDHPGPIVMGESYGEIIVTVPLPNTGTIYANVHLDYGLKGTTGWTKADVDGDTNFTDAKNSSLPTIRGLESVDPWKCGQSYHLNAEANGQPLCTATNICEDVVYSVNIFKKSVGVGGSVIHAATSAPLAGVEVKMFSDILRANQVGETAFTDSDGYYFINYKSTGASKTFYVVALGQPKMADLKANGFAVVNFQQLPSTTTSTSAATAAEPARPLARALNISTRGRVGTGDGVMIGGFIITGDTAKQVIVRAVGPSMARAGVVTALLDPQLELHDSTGQLLQANDNWRDNPQAEQAIRATGLPPTDDREAAVVAKLSPGAYTAVVRGKDGATGIALVEVYDLDNGGASQLANISTRGSVQTGEDVMIGGFVLGGETRVAIRALGPSLHDLGVSNALANPEIELRDRDGDVVARNGDWKEEQQVELEAAGVPLGRDAESAMLIDLPAGPYTAILTGSDGGSGVGLIEVYSIR